MGVDSYTCRNLPQYRNLENSHKDRHALELLLLLLPRDVDVEERRVDASHGVVLGV